MSRVINSITSPRLHETLSTDSPVATTGNLPAQLYGNQPIFLRDGERCWIVTVTDIAMLESQGNYTRIYFGSNSPMLHRSLKHLYQRLDSSAFFRANRRFVINLRFVKDIQPSANGGYLVRLTSGFAVLVSRRQAHELKHQLAL